jgi:predicted nucleotidyltransferase component of viral defense system
MEITTERFGRGYSGYYRNILLRLCYYNPKYKTLHKKKGVRADIIDKDYVIGHFVNHLFSKSWAQEHLVFKGGTCLRKCYFEDYRFSEDLDFTLLDSHFELKTTHLSNVCREIEQETGIKLYTQPI